MDHAVDRRARRRGGNAVLTHVSDVTRYVLDIMGLQEPLEVYETPAAALAALAKSGRPSDEDAGREP